MSRVDNDCFSTYRRRECLKVLGAGMLIGCAGCGLSISEEPLEKPLREDDTLARADTSEEEQQSDTAIGSTVECLEEDLQIQLRDYPVLRHVGGSAAISFPDDFIHLLVICVAEQQWIAVWKICTHGNCDVEWAEDLALVRCPCHDSLFDWNGVVLQGPATRDLSSFSVCVQENGEVLHLRRIDS